MKELIFLNRTFDLWLIAPTAFTPCFPWWRKFWLAAVHWKEWYHTDVCGELQTVSVSWDTKGYLTSITCEERSRSRRERRGQSCCYINTNRCKTAGVRRSVISSINLTYMYVISLMLCRCAVRCTVYVQNKNFKKFKKFKNSFFVFKPQTGTRTANRNR